MMRAVGAVLDGLVHAEARRDRRLRDAHARFIGARVLGACAACALLPIYLVMRESVSFLELTIIAAITLLLVPAAYVSWSGRLERGHDLSSVLLTLSIVALAVQSGGIQSPAMSLFAVVILDPALAASRPALRNACATVAAGAVAIALTPSLSLGTALEPITVALALGVYTLAIAVVVVQRGERHRDSQMRSQARAQVALDAVGDAVLWCERDGQISFANAAAHTTLGVDRRAFHETALFERVNVGDRPAFLRALSEARVGTGSGAAVIRIAVDGAHEKESRVFELAAHRVDPAAGEAIVLALRDITVRQAADEMRESAKREAERMAMSKSQFLATMSHELRTPLNAIIGFSELLLQPAIIPANDPRREEYARIINGSGQHLLEVVNAILDMSKIESGMMSVEQEKVEVARTLQSSREILAVRAGEKGVTLVEHLASGLPDIVADRRALKQVLINLMSNAVKFTPPAGEVTITAVRDRDHVEIAVADTGCGIAEDDLSQLGNPFFQAKQSYDRQHEGTGLGLSVVRGLVGLMGGSMLIESAPGAGTRVAIRLPIAGVAAGASTEPVNITTRLRAKRGLPDAAHQDLRAAESPPPRRLSA